MISAEKHAKQLVDVTVEMWVVAREVWWCSHVLPANPDGGREQEHRVRLFRCAPLLISLHSRPCTLCDFCTPTPHRERERHQLSLTHFLSFSRPDRLANLLSPDHQPLATANCLQPCYSAYCLLSATPSSATLATPLLSTACGTIKLQLSYEE